MLGKKPKKTASLDAAKKSSRLHVKGDTIVGVQNPETGEWAGEFPAPTPTPTEQSEPSATNQTKTEDVNQYLEKYEAMLEVTFAADGLTGKEWSNGQANVTRLTNQIKKIQAAFTYTGSIHFAR